MGGPDPIRIDEAILQLADYLNLFFALGGTIFLVFGVILGIRYMVSRGDPDELQNIRSAIGIWVAGFVIFFLSYTIVFTTFRVLGVKDCTGNTLIPDPVVLILPCPP